MLYVLSKGIRKRGKGVLKYQPNSLDTLAATENKSQNMDTAITQALT